jgi:hypothetical protein
MKARSPSGILFAHDVVDPCLVEGGLRETQSEGVTRLQNSDQIEGVRIARPRWVSRGQWDLAIRALSETIPVLHQAFRTVH